MGWQKRILAFCVLGVLLGAARADTATVLLAAGDIGQCGSPGTALTAALLRQQPGAILALGDLAYRDGSAEEFRRCYDPYWGPFKARTHPVPGNHDYRTPEAAGYFAYFGARAGDPARGYYSFNLGAWHIVALNSNRELEPGSPQLQWLDADLRAHRQRCVLAYWHHPRYSSGLHGSDPRTQALWQSLYRHGVSIVLGGHDHHYERLLPINDRGERDDARGVRSFVVGSGGAKRYELKETHPLSIVRDNTTWGVLKLTLHEASYEWAFLPVTGGVRDQGAATCVAR
jgi:3',5'-cyclic AMP phosphodiesterase CpdA